MNLYLLTRNDDWCYESFDALVVAAESEADAITIRPESRGTTAPCSGWTTPENIAATLIGVAVAGTERGVILESYDAG
jgi:hypothetical protein